MRHNDCDSNEDGKRRPRWHQIGGVMALVVLFGAACSSSSSGNAGSNSSGGGSTINIGEIADLSGPLTFPRGVDGANAPIAAVNAGGGLGGPTLHLVLGSS